MNKALKLITFVGLFFSFLILNAQTSKNIYPFKDVERIYLKDSSLILHKMQSMNNKVWAVDYGNGEIHESNNNFEWAKNITLKSEYFENIQFVDSIHGFVSGDYGYVYKTISGGNEWIDISPKIKKRITARFRNDSTKNQKPDGQFVAYYDMHFKNKKEGYVSGFKYNPKIGFRESYKRLLFKTEDSGNTWELLKSEDQRNYLGLFLRSINSKEFEFNNTYYFNGNTYKTGKNKSKDDIVTINSQTKIILPKTNFNRIMLRKILFTNDKNGFIFGGSLDENNQKAVIYYTSDGGNNWELLNCNWPHIHDAIKYKDGFLISGKENFLINVKY